MKNAKYILLILFLAIFIVSNAQDISGRWLGEHSYAKKITLDLIQNKDSVTGIGYVEFKEKIGRANIYIEGTFHNGVFEYETKKILEQAIDSNFVLCFVAGKEYLSIKKNKHIMEGACISIDKKEDCFDLSAIEKYTKKVNFSFSKNDFNGRKVLVVDTIYATQDSLELSLWDNMKEDGDIVSVFLNKEKIISNYLLKNQPQKIKIICNDGVNEILCYAHNLGSIPPNTATIAIYQNGHLLKEMDLKSDANKSESFIIMKR